MSNTFQNIKGKVSSLIAPSNMLRIGLFILATAGLVGCTVIASLSWLQVLTKLPYHKLNPQDTAALYLHTTLFTLLILAFVALFPIAFLKLRRVGLGYAATLAVLLLFSFISGIYTLWAMYKPNTKRRIALCMGKKTDRSTKDMCTNGLAMWKEAAVVIYVMTWIILSVTMVMVYFFTRQLATDPEDPGQQTTQIRGRSVGNPAPLTMYNSFGAAGHNTGYAFSSVDNSFGRGTGIRAVPMAV